jgi:hypothetical protein
MSRIALGLSSTTGVIAFITSLPATNRGGFSVSAICTKVSRGTP